MPTKLRLTLLSDNSSSSPLLRREHGLAVLLESPSHRVLFDTGAGKALFPNAAALGIDLHHLDAIVLSHGHDDHSGSLAKLVRNFSPAALFLHPAALQTRFVLRPGKPPLSIGLPPAARRALDRFSGRVVFTSAPTPVAPGITCSGSIPRPPAFLPNDPSLTLDPAGAIQDPILDDQSLFLDTPAGPVLLAGCLHSGLDNTLAHLRALTGATTLAAFLGGLHLMHSEKPAFEAAANLLGRWQCPLLAPCHCTGRPALAYFRARFHSLFRPVGAGSVLHFPEC